MQQIVDELKDSEEGGTSVKENNTLSLSASLHNKRDEQRVQIDSGYALQQFLDHIPISSIPGIKSSFDYCNFHLEGEPWRNVTVAPCDLKVTGSTASPLAEIKLRTSFPLQTPPVLELKAGDNVKDAIQMLYEKDIFGAPIADVLDPNAASIRFSYRYIGFIDFPTMVLWCLEEYENIRLNFMDNGHEETRNNGFFSILDQIPQIGQTKVGKLAKPSLWEPFFPIHLNDTLFHALLLLSKHRLHVLPVTQNVDPQVIGFVSQNAVVQLLLESTGLEWFDSIADKSLSELRIGNQEHASHVFGDQTVADALHVLWKNRPCTLAVLDGQSKKLIGSVSNNDVYHLVENDELFRNRKILSVGEFIRSDSDKIDADPTIEIDNGASPIAGCLHLKKSFIPRMDSPVTNKKSDTLKQVMKHMTERNSSYSFLINDSEQVTGLLTLRDIILQFAPPCVSSSIDGGGFFEFALEQSGCHVENGTLIRNH